MKQCSRCKKIKVASKFSKRKDTKCGLSSWCKACKRETWKNNKGAKTIWHQENIAFLHELKINGCAICSYNKCDAALDFHHVNPKDKKFTVGSNAITRRDLIDEVNKCILLCKNCHMEIHNRGI